MMVYYLRYSVTGYFSPTMHAQEIAPLVSIKSNKTYLLQISISWFSESEHFYSILNFPSIVNLGCMFTGTTLSVSRQKQE